MDKKWRPAGFVNPYGTTEFKGNPQIDADLLLMAKKAQAYEAGADAMLESLREFAITSQIKTTDIEEAITNIFRKFGQGMVLAEDNVIIWGTETAGRIVFIPDDNNEIRDQTRTQKELDIIKSLVNNPTNKKTPRQSGKTEKAGE